MAYHDVRRPLKECFVRGGGVRHNSNIVAGAEQVIAQRASDIRICERGQNSLLQIQGDPVLLGVEWAEKFFVPGTNTVSSVKKCQWHLGGVETTVFGFE